MCLCVNYVKLSYHAELDPSKENPRLHVNKHVCVVLWAGCELAVSPPPPGALSVLHLLHPYIRTLHYRIWKEGTLTIKFRPCGRWPALAVHLVGLCGGIIDAIPECNPAITRATIGKDKCDSIGVGFIKLVVGCCPVERARDPKLWGSISEGHISSQAALAVRPHPLDTSHSLWLVWKSPAANN